MNDLYEAVVKLSICCREITKRLDEITEKLNSPMYGPGIEDPDD